MDQIDELLKQGTPRRMGLPRRAGKSGDTLDAIERQRMLDRKDRSTSTVVMVDEFSCVDPETYRETLKRMSDSGQTVPLLFVGPKIGEALRGDSRFKDMDYTTSTPLETIDPDKKIP